MGGSGAKVRRRLERESLSSNQSKKSVTPKSSASVKTTTAKFKKPKHLKRKIESLSTAPCASTDKERLVQELHEFDKAKEHKRQATTKSTQQPSLATTTPTIKPSKPHTETKRIDQAERAANTDRTKVPHVKSTGSSKDNGASNVKTAPLESAPQKQLEDASVDSDGEMDTLTNTRQRGKRRRGRSKPPMPSEVTESPDEPDATVEPTTNAELESKPTSDDTVDGNDDTPTKRRRENDDRRCIGRKPLTDFQVGKSYPGKVVYAKPFGVFIDIGCHSDAFCHVSRLSDDFLESPESQFPPGTVIDAARVVEVDRSRKRITVSLQSDARVQDEMASMAARQDRRHKLGRTAKAAAAASSKQATKQSRDKPESRPTSVERQALPSSKPAPPITPVESVMDPKRARKQARRATRRAERDQQDETTQ